MADGPGLPRPAHPYDLEGLLVRVHFVDDDEPVEALLLRMELGSYVLLSRGAAETLLIPWHRVRRTELVVHDDDPSKGEED